MAYWLFKSEPFKWGWDDQTKAGEKGTQWTGVRNYQARNFMRDMKVGDKGFFYHSVNEKCVVGIVEVCKPWYLDPSDPKGIFGMVDVRALEPLPKPVTLAEVKADERLAAMPLVSNTRTSKTPSSQNPNPSPTNPPSKPPAQNNGNSSTSTATVSTISSSAQATGPNTDGTTPTTKTASGSKAPSADTSTL